MRAQGRALAGRQQRRSVCQLHAIEGTYGRPLTRIFIRLRPRSKPLRSCQWTCTLRRSAGLLIGAAIIRGKNANHCQAALECVTLHPVSTLYRGLLLVLQSVAGSPQGMNMDRLGFPTQHYSKLLPARLFNAERSRFSSKCRHHAFARNTDVPKMRSTFLIGKIEQPDMPDSRILDRVDIAAVG